MEKTPTILIVEDDNDIATLLKINLENNGYHTHIATNGKEAIEFFDSNTANLVILDIMLPIVNGIDVLKNIRYERKLKNLPIIIVSAKTDESDILTGLELGADDYIPKPFSSKILLVKVKTLLKKIEDSTYPSDTTNNRNVISVDGLFYDKDRHICLLDDSELNLTATEFALLGILISDMGRTFSREQLMDNVKGGEYFSLERTIDVQIATLRKKLKKLGSCIKTVWGVGYKWEQTKQN